MRTTQTGFSLVEMIAVILLLGIIASFVAPSIFRQVDQGKAKATATKVKALSTKIETYAMDIGTMPDSLENLVRAPGNADGWNGPYAKESDLVDAWNQPFIYRMPGEDGADFDLISLGADKKPGGENTKADISAAQ